MHEYEKTLNNLGRSAQSELANIARFEYKATASMCKHYETKEGKKIIRLINKCFEIGQAGWDEEEDRKEYIEKAQLYATELGLMIGGNYD